MNVQQLALSCRRTLLLPTTDIEFTLVGMPLVSECTHSARHARAKALSQDALPCQVGMYCTTGSLVLKRKLRAVATVDPHHQVHANPTECMQMQLGVEETVADQPVYVI